MKTTTAQVNYGDRKIRFKINFFPRSKLARKIRIHLHYDGTIEVEAPSGEGIKEIQKAVQKRGKWLNKHIDHLEKNRSTICPRQFISGETHLYLGRRYVLKITKLVPSSKKTESVKLLGGQISVSTFDTSPENVRQLLEAWYKERSQFLIPRYLKQIVSNVSWIKTIPSIRFRVMEKRWGSCSSKGRLSLNSRLICAPKECINYVLWHEICHLKEANHSKQFYKLLSKQLPEWKITKIRLDEMAELILSH